MAHIDNITALKDGIGLRAYGQNDPLIAFKNESFAMFEEMNETIRRDSIQAVFTTVITEKAKEPIAKSPVITSYSQKDEGGSSIGELQNGNRPVQKVKQEPIRVEKKVGRNEPCPCGSGRKYKQCCGKGAQ